MPTVETESGAYQDLDRIRQRIDVKPDDIFDDNAALRFDELLVELEVESRGIFETLWGDQTPLTETDRVDERRATDDAALLMPYPVQSVSKVERKVAQSSDWLELDSDHYDHTEHRLILARRPNINTMRYRQRANPLTADADRATWRDIATTLRITYDRGFGEEPPADIQSIQIQLISNFLRKRKVDQTLSAASPGELADQMTADMVVTEEIRQRIGDVTRPGGATLSV